MKYSYGQQVRRSGVVVEERGWYADSVWEYHLRAEELPRYRDDAARYINRLVRMPHPARKSLEHVTIRCPTKGCLLATIYEFAKVATAEEKTAGLSGGVQCLYVGQTPSGTEVWDILNYSCACAQVLYWRAGCRCGTASLDRSWMMDLFVVAAREHSGRETEEEAIAALPAHLRSFWGKRVFHPDPAAWHAKQTRRRVVKSRPTSDRARAAQGE